MKLTAYPFDAATGELIPAYRDAYLRGDLSFENTQLVDAFLKADARVGAQTWERFHAMQQDGEQVRPVGWMSRQLNQLQTSPRRVRQQAMTAVVALALVGGAVFASTGTNPVVSPEGDAPLAVTSAMKMSTLRGRILNENGRPLVGATVFEKGTHRGVSTDANGEYALVVPAGQPTTLAYGYGGYTDSEVLVKGTGTARSLDNMTLVPDADAKKAAHKARRWWQF